MLAKVVAVEPAEFKTWLATKKREIEAANKAAQTRREAEAKDAAAGDSPTGRSAEPARDDRAAPTTEGEGS